MKKKRLVASVILAKTQGLPEKSLVALANFKCGTCGDTRAVNAGIEQPFCGACGGDMAPYTAKVEAEDLYALASNQLVEFPCVGKDCGAHLKMSLSTAHSLNGVVHCNACNTKMTFAAEDLGGDEVDEDEDEGILGGDGVNEDEQQEAGDGDAGEGDAQDSLEDEKSESSDDQDADDKSEGEQENAGEGCDDDKSESSDDQDADDESNASDDKDEDDKPAGDEVDLVNLVDDSELAAHRVGASIVLFAGDVSVASIRATQETAAVFDRESFLRVVQSTLANSGVRATIDRFGFVPARVKVDASMLNRNEVAAQLTAERARLDEDRTRFADVLRQSLAIAAAKLNRNMANVENPLKRELFEALSALSIKGGEKLIESAFRVGADEYHTTLLALAFDLAAKPDEVRNEIAAVIGASDYLDPEMEDDDQEAGGGDDDMSADELEELLNSEEEARFPVTSSVHSRLSRGMKKTAESASTDFAPGTLFKRSF